MEDFKEVKIRYINGCKVTSRTLVLTEEEEAKKLTEVKEMFISVLKAKEKTA